MSEIVIVAGVNGGGKTTFTKENFDNYWRINRDEIGGTLDSMVAHLEAAINHGRTKIILDNTYKTAASRKGVLDVAKKHGCKIVCYWLNTSTDQAMINVCMRMLDKYGKILSPDEIREKGKKDPGVFPVAAIYGFHSKKKGMKPEIPSKEEGFDEVVLVDFKRSWPADWTNKGLIFDYDDTLRYILKDSGCLTKFPTKPEHIGLLPRRKEVIESWVAKGYGLFGASNQSGVAKGDLTHEEAIACFQTTNDLLGHQIPVNFCPHQAGAAICYCRKPAPGLLLDHMFRHRLDPNQTIFVGDQTSDKTTATRLGIQYFHESQFFSA